MTTYPDFMLLPRGIKRLLLASDNYFFDETAFSSLPVGTGVFSTTEPASQNRGLMFPFTPKFEKTNAVRV